MGCEEAKMRSGWKMSRRQLSSVLLLATTLLAFGFLFPQVYSANGTWRLVSPTEFSTNIPGKNSIRGVFAINGGTGGVNSANGWGVGDQGFIFHWDGFSWRQYGVAPSGCELNSVNFGGPLIPSGSNFAGVSNSPGWIVGGTGAGAVGPCAAATALYNDGSGMFGSWTVYDSQLVSAGVSFLSSVYTVTGSGSVEAWAVGSDSGANGAFWHWFGTPGSGGGWVEFNAGVAATPVRSVYMTHCCTGGSADDGWAVGDSGDVYHWTGGNWLLFQTVAPSSCLSIPNLNGVAMDSTTDGWAVGDCGSIYHYSGGTWGGPVSPGTTSNPLRSIVMLSNSEAWAVGDADGSGPTILHGTNLNGAPNWIRIPVIKLPLAGNLFSVTYGVSNGNIWSVGQGGFTALCYSGCSDSSFWGTTTAPLATTFNSAFMTGDNDGWVVGLVANGMPTVYHWDGATLTRGNIGFPARDLFGVFMTSSGEGWAVGGTGGTAETAHFTSGSWTDVPAPACACQLNGIYMAGSSNGWAVGTAGIIMHLPTSSGPWLGSSNIGDPTGTFNSVFFDPGDSTKGWAVGATAGVVPEILHTTNGGLDGWVGPLLNPGGIANGLTLRSIFMRDNTHMFVVGQGSTILFSGNDGATWTQQLIAGVVNAPLDLRGVYLDSNNDGWAVGTDSTGHPVLVQYDGTGWTELTYPYLFFNTGTLNGLFLTSSTNGLAVGTPIAGDPTTLGLVFHLDPPGTYGGGSASTTVITSFITTTTSASTSTTSATSTTATSSSSTLAASSTSQVTSSTASTTTSNPATVTTTVQTTPTTIAAETTLAISTVSTPMALPPIPGFPWESIIAGIILGMAALAILRRRK